MIISIDSKRAFDKIQHIFTLKITQNTRQRQKLLQCKKGYLF